jgi:hypothetical protein
MSPSVVRRGNSLSLSLTAERVVLACSSPCAACDQRDRLVRRNVAADREAARALPLW